MNNMVQKINATDKLLSAVAACLLLAECGNDSQPPATAVSAPTQDLPGIEETQVIAREAYLYGFPVVMNYKTMYEYTIDTDGPDYKGPFNELACDARLFTPEDKAVVTPNADTPYCMFWMDLQAEPLVLSVPGMDAERYYSFQLIDLYTHNFAYIGNLATGSEAGSYLLAGPDWEGDVPQGIDDIIRAETDIVFNYAALCPPST